MVALDISICYMLERCYVYHPKTQQYFNYAVNSLADKDDAVVFKKVLALFGDLVQCH